jgi:hypothetical protein
MIIFFIVLFLAVTSKEFLVYNEETLVLASFIFFVAAMSKSLKDVTVSTLLARGAALQKELEDNITLREEILTKLISYHQKKMQLFNEVTELLTFSSSELNVLLLKRQQALKFHIVNQVEQKLKRIVERESKTLQEIAYEVGETFAKEMTAKFSSKDASSANAAVFKQAIQSFKQLG